MSNSKNIVFVNFSETWGGGELQHLELADEFQRQGYNSFIITQPESELAKKASEKLIATHVIKVSKITFLSPFVLKQLRKMLVGINPDAIILNSPWELKHVTFCTSNKSFNIIYRRGYFSTIKPTILNRFCLKRISYLVVISAFLQKRALASISKFCIHQPVVIHNGISPLVLQQPKYQAKRIIAVGRLVESKKFEWLIKAMPSILQRTPDAQLWIVGDGPLHQSLDTLIAQLQLTNSVFLIGFQMDVNQFLAESSLFVHAATEEAFGVVFIEAMRQMLPCIAFRGHAADEIIEHQRTGLLVDEVSIEALSNSITSILSSPEKLADMGQAGYERFKNNFTIERSVEKFIQLLK